MGNGRTYGDFQGFVAEHYDVWFSQGRESSDYFFYKQKILDNEGPAVEIGCGTGRLLIPYLEDGLDVDGIDYSEDMLNICKNKAERFGINATLYNQPMQRLDLPRKYKTIYIPGNTFILLTNRADAMEALKRIHSHLIDGGQLLLTLSVPKKYMLNDQSDEWSVIAEVYRDDGAKIILREQVFINYWEQLKVNFNKYEVVKDDVLVEEHLDTINIRWFYKYEFELMLELNGFKDIEISNGYSPSTQGDGSSMVISARK